VAFIGVQFCATCLLFLQLGNHDLWASHEARAAQNAQYNLDTQHWGLLRLFDGTPEYQKAPLYYWLVAGVARLRGGQVDEIAVRLPAAIAGWLTVGAIIVFSFEAWQAAGGLDCGFGPETTHHFLSISRTGRIDVPLTCAVTLAILLAMGSRPWLSGYVWRRDDVEGTVGVVIVMVVVLTSRRRFYEASRTIVRAGVVGLLLGLPWFVAVGIEPIGRFGASSFWHHNLQRAAGSASDLATHPICYTRCAG